MCAKHCIAFPSSQHTTDDELGHNSQHTAEHFRNQFRFIHALTVIAERRTASKTIVDHERRLGQHTEITDGQINHQRIGGRSQRTATHKHKDDQRIAQHADGHYARVHTAERDVSAGRRRFELQPERIDGRHKCGVQMTAVGGQRGRNRPIGGNNGIWFSLIICCKAREKRFKKVGNDD